MSDILLHMLRWCSYCETYIGESEPRSNFSFTHGICKQCKGQHRNVSAKKNALSPIRSFYSTLQSTITFSNLPDANRILEESESLGIRHSDLLIGMIQPLLYQIGNLYSEGKITVHQEHQFSEFVDGVLHSMRQRAKPPSLFGAKDDVLLTCIDSNYHSFGVRFLEQLLLDEGICASSVYPSLPIAGTMALAEERGVTIVGISAFLDSQLTQLREIPELLKRWKSGTPPLIVVGGQAVEGQPILGVQYHNRSAKDFVSLVRETLAARRQSAAS